MRVTPTEDDAPDFILAVNQVVEGLVRDANPQSLIVIQIDNWFGPRWLHFAGKVLGALGVHNNQTLRVPPFIPGRVLSERWFTGPLFDESDPGQPIHEKMASVKALGRKISDVAPGAAVLWYSGNSRDNNRGSLMAYTPVGGKYTSWHAQWENKDSWHLAQVKNIRVVDLMKLMESKA